MTKPEDKAICIKCKHHYQEGDGRGRKIWYNNKCRAVKPKQYFDYVLGEWITEDIPYCRDFNSKGECPYYELECPKNIFGRRKNENRTL